MKRFHNPMTMFMIIILSIMLAFITCFLIFLENVPQALFIILPCFFLLIVLVTVWGEYKFRKSDAEMSLEKGEEINTAEDVSANIMKGPKKVVILSIIITLAVLAIFVALCMYNALIGITLIVIVVLAIILYPIYKAKTITTVEKYILSKKGNVRHLLQMIHEQILEVVPGATPVIDRAVLSPSYFYVKDLEKSEIYRFISVQAIIGGKNICIYPNNPDVFTVFADRLNGYRINGYSELYIPTNQPLDCDLIKDIIKFNMSQITMISDRNDF